mmetsp:Transcript_14752/g.57877  ORF Transcript_14752/g.57877 Transcript_14752/m.57877 type:complete len:250 (-) Transcript_14752:89-838(-)
MSSHRTDGDASRMSLRRFSASAASGPPRASNGSGSYLPPAPPPFPIAAFAPPRGSLRWPYPDDATGFFLARGPGSPDAWALFPAGSLRAHAGSLESSRLPGGAFAGESLGVGALHTSGSRSGEGARFSLRARPTPPRHMASSSSLERLGARPGGAPARALVDGGSGPSCTGPGRFAATCGTSPRARAAAALEPGRVENIPRSASRFVTASSSSVSCRWTARHRPTRNGSALASSSVLCTCLETWVSTPW